MPIPEIADPIEFEEKVVLRAGGPVLVQFYANWSGPCCLIFPEIEKLAEERSGQCMVARVNIDSGFEIAMEYGVRGIPALLIFDKGKPVGVKVGSFPKNKLDQWIDSVLAVLDLEQANSLRFGEESS